MSDPTAAHDEYLDNPAGWRMDAVATLLDPVETRGPAVIRRGHVHWKMQPAIPCPRCETPLERGRVTLAFHHAPAASREQAVDGFVCACGEFYVPGVTAREAHRRAFAAWLDAPDLRIPGLEEHARALLGAARCWEDRFEAAVALHECIRLELGRMRRDSARAPAHMLALQRICAWACAAGDASVASRAWQRLAEIGEVPATILSEVEQLVRDFDTRLSHLAVGREELRSLAREFVGDAQLWEQLAEREASRAAREDALIRAARLKGIVGIEDRHPLPAGDAVPITLDGAIVVSPMAA